MHSWTTPHDVRALLQRWWDKGELLQAGELPRRIPLKTPNTKELRDHFDAVRQWSQQLRDMPNIRVEMREFRHQLFGQNSLPDTAWIDHPAQAIALIGKQKEARIFHQILRSTAEKQPNLLIWLEKRPLRAIELAAEWDKLLAVVDWLLAHPRPAIYLRQMDIPGVHSKFVENRRAVLSEWLDLLLPAEAIDHQATGSSQFNRRYGFCDKPERIRWRYLDPACAPLAQWANADLTLDASSFADLNPAVDRVFITENEINFLTFPAVDRSLLIFGAGYGFTALAQAHWLHQKTIYYWGDIDTHGLAILNTLRRHFPQVQSLLMDEATLLAHAALWGEEPQQQTHSLEHLNASEAALYEALRRQTFQTRLRLEQEHISYAWACARITEATIQPSTPSIFKMSRKIATGETAFVF